MSTLAKLTIFNEVPVNEKPESEQKRLLGIARFDERINIIVDFINAELKTPRIQKKLLAYYRKNPDAFRDGVVTDGCDKDGFVDVSFSAENLLSLVHQGELSETIDLFNEKKKIVFKNQIRTALKAIVKHLCGCKVSCLVGATQCGKTGTQSIMQILYPAISASLMENPVISISVLPPQIGLGKQSLSEYRYLFGIFSRFAVSSGNVTRTVGQVHRDTYDRFRDEYNSYINELAISSDEHPSITPSNRENYHMEEKGTLARRNRSNVLMIDLITQFANIHKYSIFYIIDECHWGVGKKSLLSEMLGDVFTTIAKESNDDVSLVNDLVQNLTKGSHIICGVSATPYELLMADDVDVVTHSLVGENSMFYVGYNYCAGETLDEEAVVIPPTVHSIEDAGKLYDIPTNLIDMECYRNTSGQFEKAVAKPVPYREGIYGFRGSHDDYQVAVCKQLNNMVEEFLLKNNPKQANGCAIRFNNTNNKSAEIVEKMIDEGLDDSIKIVLSMGAVNIRAEYRDRIIQKGTGTVSEITDTFDAGTKYLMVVTGKGRMGDQFEFWDKNGDPLPCSYYVDLTTKTSSLSTLIQGTIGRATGWGKDPIIILSNQNAEAEALFRRTRGAAHPDGLQYSRHIKNTSGKSKLSNAAVLIQRSEWATDPVIVGMFEAIDEKYTNDVVYDSTITHKIHISRPVNGGNWVIGMPSKKDLAKGKGVTEVTDKVTLAILKLEQYLNDIYDVESASVNSSPETFAKRLVSLKDLKVSKDDFCEVWDHDGSKLEMMTPFFDILTEEILCDIEKGFNSMDEYSDIELLRASQIFDTGQYDGGNVTVKHMCATQNGRTQIAFRRSATERKDFHDGDPIVKKTDRTNGKEYRRTDPQVYLHEENGRIVITQIRMATAGGFTHKSLRGHSRDNFIGLFDEVITDEVLSHLTNVYSGIYENIRFIRQDETQNILGRRRNRVNKSYNTNEDGLVQVGFRNKGYAGEGIKSIYDDDGNVIPEKYAVQIYTDVTRIRASHNEKSCNSILLLTEDYPVQTFRAGTLQNTAYNEFGTSQRDTTNLIKRHKHEQRLSNMYDNGRLVDAWERLEGVITAAGLELEFATDYAAFNMNRKRIIDVKVQKKSIMCFVNAKEFSHLVETGKVDDHSKFNHFGIGDARVVITSPKDVAIAAQVIKLAVNEG